MHLFDGTIAQAAAQVRDPRFFAECVRRFTHAHGVAPGPGERRSWERSWPVLLDALTAAGLGSLRILLEYPLPGTGQRVDAVVLGQRVDDARLTAVVVELKQWEHATPCASDALLLEVGERVEEHPARQVGSYAHYLTNWVSQFIDLEVRGVVVMHNAAPHFVGGLREAVKGGPSSAYPILGRRDLDPKAPAGVLADRMACGGLRPAPEPLVMRFLKTRHQPSPKLLSRVADAIRGTGGFTLIGDQDKARLHIRDAATAIRDGQPGHIVVVTGGPGTGKTAIAARVLGDLCRLDGANPRLLSPSGALTQQLGRAVGDAAKGLITTITRGVPGGLSKDSIVLIDEAHRLRTDAKRRSSGFPDRLQWLAERCGAIVLFLDERQIIRPSEGTTLEELRRLAAYMRYAFTHIDLTTQFRCAGSHYYLRWIDDLFAHEGSPLAWNGSDYDLALAESPQELEAWTNSHIERGYSARIAAGFCWPWKSPPKPPLLPEVSINWVDEWGTPQSWKRPWNSQTNKAIGVDSDIPGRPFWATDPGGHRQIGCIYTAQGLEYDYGAVIVGDDLVRTPSGWEGRPSKSYDREVNYLPPEKYLIYALNTYRVLATRGTRGTRLYATDPDTQRFLRSLLPRT
ncbi:DNA/RNA helicase domain-containing protein [Nonomuraea sp. NPDC026600]|uniref:DNA/RNA helicase domain-containing protein n=1 Tax=Nonomuraea sp. NPDC026600 TaxID=3155363 RepID=UPI0033F0B905